MQKQHLILAAFMALSAFTFQACEKDNDLQKKSILPGSFKVEIPSPLTVQSPALKSAMVDTINGNEVYRQLNTFIAIGDGAANLVQGIITAITVYNIDRVKMISYTSDDDQRDKNLVVTAQSEFEGTVWDYELTITDLESEGMEDGGKAIQVFWNTNPVKGIAILKPYNINRKDNETPVSALYRIDYNEAPEMNYDATMVVSIAGIPLADPLEDPYSVRALKMFVGKKGSVVDVFGNTDHPNARFFSNTTGFNWAFTASGDEGQDIAVAEVGLPPSGLDETSREQLIDYYSIRNVFERGIYAAWPSIDPSSVNALLYNTQAPGYFNHDGFIQGGTAPSEAFAPLNSRIEQLTPYNPKDIAELSINFK
jgi:hypothetical protein